LVRDLQIVLDAVLDGVVVVDDRGRVELVNAEACRILETSAEAALGEPLERIATADAALATMVRTVLVTGRASIESERSVKRRFDEELFVDIAASPLLEGRQRVGVVLALRDRTIQRSLQQRASEREHLSAFGHIAAGIAHEVKNPLGGIRGAAEILAARASEGKTRDAAELIVREVDRIASLVDDLMLFTHGEDVRRTPFNIHRVLGDVVELMSMDPVAGGVELERRFDPSIPDLVGDPDRLTQVFLNLTRNALQAMEGRGTLQFETRITLSHRLAGADGGTMPTLLVTVADDGPGIAPEILDKVTTPLFTTRRGGTGLGLALARHWVARHGGTLRIESAPGEGTKIRVALPLGEPPEGARG
jgi:two-component system nitrogen regulation sensor histidine kinase GlnL